MELNKVYCGDCLDVLKTLPENSVDSICCDPPYELGFMGKSWDNTGIANNPLMWAECLRVLKPGGHLLAFSGTRTYHRMAVAIEDAGFEVRDMIEWVYGSGMSKGNVWNEDKKRTSDRLNKENDLMVANGYEGWGNVGMKPSHEPIAFCRKPIEKGLTVAENCLKWGTGGINIDESRVEASGDVSGWSKTGSKAGENRSMSGANYEREAKPDANKRFPANLIHDNSEEVRECFPETKSQQRVGKRSGKETGIMGAFVGQDEVTMGHNDSGNASRFFKSILYYPKASKSERNKGCEGLEEKQTWASQEIRESNSFDVFESDGIPKTLNKNNHPTVKPIALMEYLIKMVTPKGGIVLDPFTGSGSTLVAAKQNGFQYIGIEMTEEYIPIIEARLNAVEKDLFINPLPSSRM